MGNGSNVAWWYHLNNLMLCNIHGLTIKSELGCYFSANVLEGIWEKETQKLSKKKKEEKPHAFKLIEYLPNYLRETNLSLE